MSKYLTVQGCRGANSANGFNVVKKVVRLREDLHRISTEYSLDTNKNSR